VGNRPAHKDETALKLLPAAQRRLLFLFAFLAHILQLFDRSHSNPTTTTTQQTTKTPKMGPARNFSK